MRVSRILSFYVAREIVQYTAVGLMAVATILVTQNLLRRLDDLAGVGFQASDAVSVLVALFGMLLAYAVPVAFLFGVLVAVGRLSSDSEVTAMRVCGFGMSALLIPALLLGVLTSLMTGYLMIEVEHKSRRELRTIISKIATRGGLAEPGRFTTVGDRILFVQGRSEDGELSKVLIFDRSDPENPYTVFAERARFLLEKEKREIHLKLETGDLHLESMETGEKSYRRIGFDEFDYAFDASRFMADDPSRIQPSEMSLAEIQSILDHFDRNDGRPPDNVRVKTRERYEIELHRRLALPFGPILFALVGVPLGLRRSHGARSFGVLVCIGLVFSYYTVLTFATYLGEEKLASPVLALWIPNLAFALLSIPLLRRANRSEI